MDAKAACLKCLKHLHGIFKYESEAEHAELIALTDEIELAHARRLESLVQLARLRGASADDLMQEFGIREPGHA